MEEPESKMPTARARSRLGNHSETALVAAGQLADSPRPSRKRKTQKPRSPVARGVAMATREYQATARERPRRVPRRSTMRPERDWPMV